VAGERCTRADGIATALFVLVSDQGYNPAAEQGFAVLFIVKEDKEGFREQPTPEFERLVGVSQ
jgi:thiamine biosynthesis lipoprotein ApbE